MFLVEFDQRPVVSGFVVSVADDDRFSVEDKTDGALSWGSVFYLVNLLLRFVH